ncbi:MAG: hypothetical protein ACRCSV_01425 [Chlamydiales bacterium]
MIKTPASLLNRRFIEIILADKTYDPLYDLIALNPLQIAGNTVVSPLSCYCKSKLWLLKHTVNLQSRNNSRELIYCINKEAEEAGRTLSIEKTKSLMNRLSNTLSSVYAVYGNNQLNPTEFTERDHDQVRGFLKMNKASPYFSSDFLVDLSFNFCQGAYLVIAHNDLYRDIQRVFGNKFKPVYIPLPYPFENYYPEEQIGYAKQAIFVLTPNAPKWNDEDGNTLYKMIYIGKEAFGVLRHRDYPPEICLMENAKYFSWRAKLGYLTLREEHVVNHIVTLQEQ